MKPVTEDQVQKLLSGLEAREKEALRVLSEKTGETKEPAGRMTARVFGFRSSSVSPSAAEVADVVDMLPRRADRLRRATSAGVFLYSAVTRSTSSTN